MYSALNRPNGFAPTNGEFTFRQALIGVRTGDDSATARTEHDRFDELKAVEEIGEKRVEHCRCPIATMLPITPAQTYAALSPGLKAVF
jgi:hypothetical protein